MFEQVGQSRARGHKRILYFMWLFKNNYGTRHVKINYSKKNKTDFYFLKDEGSWFWGWVEYFEWMNRNYKISPKKCDLGAVIFDSNIEEAKWRLEEIGKFSEFSHYNISRIVVGCCCWFNVIFVFLRISLVL